jgi:hypothetical protein
MSEYDYLVKRLRKCRDDDKVRAADAIEAQAKEIANLKSSVVAFCAPWAVQYAKDFGLDGLHPGHYDLLEKCGARLVDFKRAEIKDDAPST